MFIKNVESLIKRNEQLTKKNKELEKKVFDLIHNPSKAFNYQNEMKQLISKISEIENELKQKEEDLIERERNIIIKEEKLNEKINEKKDKKISFQSKQDLSAANNETFILSRVKYCINTIIKHLNPLSKTNFFVDEKESTENFVKGLNKMISLEGFSEMLKEKTLPIEWFGLYLQSNIENIPSEYKSHNYAQLYNELIVESEKKLNKIQNDNSLNTI